MGGMVLRNSVLLVLSFMELTGKTMCGETHSLRHEREAQDMSSCVTCSLNLGRSRHELMWHVSRAFREGY